MNDTRQRSEETQGQPLIVAASPRAGGNSDHAADRLRSALESKGLSPAVVRLRNRNVLPCTGCGGCDAEGVCVYAADDDVEGLFQSLCAASCVFICSPIYFYHLPSQFKAFIDRSQSWYVRKQQGDPYLAGLQRRPMHPVLVAGRPRGERLFEGALLTLKYFGVTFALDMAEQLPLRGYDGIDDLAASPAALQHVEALALQTAKRCG